MEFLLRRNIEPESAAVVKCLEVTLISLHQTVSTIVLRLPANLKYCHDVNIPF